jgi:signal transduction histidine kinase
LFRISRSTSSAILPWPLLAAAGLVVAAVGVFLGLQIESALNTTTDITRPHDVQTRLQKARATVEALQDAVQDYLIDGAAGMRIQYEESAKLLAADLDELGTSDPRDLTAVEVADLKACTARAIATSRAVVEARPRGLDAALSLFEANLTALDGAKRELDLLIARQKDKLRASAHSLRWTVSVVGSIALTGLVLTALWLAAVMNENQRRQQQAAQAQLRAEKERLERAVNQRSEDLASAHRELAWFSRQALQTQERERQALALELHDQIGQELAALMISLKRLKDELQAAADPELMHRVDDSIEIAQGTYGSVHHLALELRPAMLDRLGLIPTLQWFARQQSRISGSAVSVGAGTAAVELAPDLLIAAFRIVQEAVNNAVRHARARKIEIIVRAAPGRLELEVRDDGEGFDPQAAEQRREADASLGLVGMRQRARDAGGELTIRSAPGQGTTVRAVLMVGPSAAA